MNRLSRGLPACAPPDPLYPLVAAAERYLSLSRAAAYRMVAAGELKTVKLGRKRLIRHSEIARVTALGESRAKVGEAA